MKDPVDTNAPLPPVVIVLLILIAIFLGAAGFMSQSHLRRRNPFEDLELEHAAGMQAPTPTPCDPDPGIAQPGHASATQTPPTPQAPAAELPANPPPIGASSSNNSRIREEGVRPVQIIIRDRLAPGQSPPTFEPGDNRVFIALPDKPPMPRGYHKPTHVMPQPVPFGPKHPDAIMFDSKARSASKKSRLSIKGLFPSYK